MYHIYYRLQTLLQDSSYSNIMIYDSYPRDREVDTEVEDESEEYVREYKDYYRAMAESRAIRPICVSEGVDFSKLSTWDTICWWFKVSLQMLR